MNDLWKKALSEQFESAIAMFEKTLRDCPDELWAGRMWQDSTMPPEFSEFWYVAYHNLFWLDFYLSGAEEGFSPPPPFDLSELDPAGKLPERQLARTELLAYLEYNREKCRAIIRNLTDDTAARLCRFHWGEMSYLELLLDTMRHTQEHTAQLSMFLGQQAGLNSRWITIRK